MPGTTSDEAISAGIPAESSGDQELWPWLSQLPPATSSEAWYPVLMANRPEVAPLPSSQEDVPTYTGLPMDGDWQSVFESMDPRGQFSIDGISGLPTDFDQPRATGELAQGIDWEKVFGSASS